MILGCISWYKNNRKKKNKQTHKYLFFLMYLLFGVSIYLQCNSGCLRSSCAALPPSTVSLEHWG